MSRFEALDAIDLRIVEVLQQDARTTNKELAGKVGLSPSACLRRVRALERNGVIQGYRTQVHPEAVGVRLQALVAIRLRVHARDSFEEVRRHLRGLPEVVSVYSLGGADDLLVHVAVRDTEHLRALTMDDLATRAEIGHLETSLIFEHERAPGLPVLRQTR